jgi:hypothetical protein
MIPLATVATTIAWSVDRTTRPRERCSSTSTPWCSWVGRWGTCPSCRPRCGWSSTSCRPWWQDPSPTRYTQEPDGFGTKLPDVTAWAVAAPDGQLARPLTMAWAGVQGHSAPRTFRRGERDVYKKWWRVGYRRARGGGRVRGAACDEAEIAGLATRRATPPESCIQILPNQADSRGI